MATPFPGLQHRDGVGGVAVMAGPVNHIDSSPSKSCAKKNEDLNPPILIFLFFHKAIRSELEGLHRAAMAFATGVGDINPLLERYHFLRAIYKHHCNAEDEVCNSCFRMEVFQKYKSPFFYASYVAQLDGLGAIAIHFDFLYRFYLCVLLQKI